LHLDTHGYSPTVLQKIVIAGGRQPSFALAATMLQELAEIRISGPQVRHLTEQVGAELLQNRDAQVQRFAARTLAPQVANVPVVAVVEVDGGRLQVRAWDAGRGVHDPAWKEDKIACLVTMQSPVQETDPHPDLPACFTDPPRVAALVRGVSSQGSLSDLDGVTATAATPEPTPEAHADATATPPTWQPAPLVRTCVATTQSSDDFGPLVAAEAQARNFGVAARQAFVGDGQAWNWTLQKAFFPTAVAIADFIHVLTYVYLAAKAVAGSAPEHWEMYLGWATSCWQGRVAEVLAALTVWSQRLGPLAPGEDPPESDPRKVISKALTYLTNNASRMDYARYRRLGLPVTSSLVESLIKQFNYRVKGTEKFWDRTGAESILQVRAALLSEDERLDKHMKTRPCLPFRRYQRHQPEGETTKTRKAG
jgi:hypothetical protein